MNGLKMNLDKNKCIIIGNNCDNSTVIVDNKQIERVKCMKHLGVFIDEKLNFDENFEKICDKILKKVNYLCRLRNKLSKDVKLLLYKTTIEPHINYCSSVLFLCSDEKLNRLQILQNRALRVILNCDIYTPIRTMLKNSDVLNVKQRIYFNVLVLLYKCMTRMVPDYLCKNLIKRKDLQPYNLRSNEDINIPRMLKAKTQNCLFYKGVQLMNDYTHKYTIENIYSKNIKNIEQYIKNTIQ